MIENNYTISENKRYSFVIFIVFVSIYAAVLIM